ncbi:uncharacterized protein ACBT44_019452 isoform 6-T6 [Syngnathus typhle]
MGFFSIFSYHQHSSQRPSYQQPSSHQRSYQQPSYQQPSSHQRSFQQPSDHWHCYPPPLVEDLTVYAHIKAVVTFAPGANVTEILQQFILNATRGFCDDDCQIDATVTPAADETPPPS